MISILVSGGPVMIPIALCAVIATIIIFERIGFYGAIKKGEKDLLPRIRASIDKGHYDEAAAICDTVEGPVSRLMKTGIAYREYSEASIKDRITSYNVCYTKLLRSAFLTRSVPVLRGRYILPILIKRMNTTIRSGAAFMALFFLVLPSYNFV